MITRPLPGPYWRKVIQFFLFGSLIFLRLPHASAQTSITGAQIRNPLPPVAALPSICKPYSVYYLTTNNTAYICTATNTFTALIAGSGGDVAVGTAIADRPPHRSQRALLTHWAPPSGSGVEALIGIGVQNAGCRNPPVHQRVEAIPTHLRTLAATD